MKKTFIVALATSLVLASGASAAFAADASASNAASVSVKVTDGPDEAKLTDAQKAAFKAELDAFKDARKVIMTTFHTAMAKAKEAFKTARELATTDEARKAAADAHKAAVSTATQIKTDALKALGPPPAKPTLTAEQIAAIAKYRQDLITFKAELAIYKDKREAIRTTFKTAKENAKEAFKTARELATTDEARKAAKEARKTAVSVARQVYEGARTALGDPPVKPEKPEFAK